MGKDDLLDRGDSFEYKRNVDEMKNCGDSLMSEQNSHQSLGGGSNPTSPLQFDKKEYRVLPCVSKETYSWILKKHYAKRIPSIMFSFGLYKNKKLMGICVLGMPPCQMNYGSGIFENYKVDTYELTRLVINDNHESNLLSFFVSKVIKQMPKPCCLVSFADPNNFHHGYIYQATNWIYTGLTQKGGKDKQWILNNREYHAKTITIERMKEIGMSYDYTKNMTENWKDNGGQIEENPLRKFRYLYFCGNPKQKQEMKNKLLLKILPYPKGDNKRYDASYQPEIQQILF